MEFCMRKAGFLIVVMPIVGVLFSIWLFDRPSTTNSQLANQIELTFWDTGPGPGWRGYWEGTIARFEAQHPDIKIRYERINTRHLRPRLDVANADGNPPDLFTGVIGELVTNVDSGIIMALDEFVPTWGGRDDVMTKAIQAGTHEGHVYGISHWFSPNIFIYRKDFFADAGLDPESPPSTWEELADTAVQLTRREGRNVVRSGLAIAPDDVALLISFGRQNGARLNTEEGLPDIASDAWVETFEYFQNLVREKKVNVVATAGEFLPTQYIEHRAAIAPMYAGTLSGTLFRESGLREVTGFFRTKRKFESAWRGCAMMHITSKTNHPEAAWKFYTFTLSKEETWKRYLATGAPVVLESLVDEYLEDDLEMNSAILEGVVFGKGLGKTRFTPPTRALMTAFERVLYEGASPGTELQRAQKALMLEINGGND
jgi:ABC-type glycerol-3-phosphate transport system substrate-binding protein